MSQIVEYIRNLFSTKSNHNRKRRRAELFLEEREPIPKYKKVTNIFPKTYTNLLDDEADLFQEVKLNKPLYNELLENFYMDQQKKHLKAVLDDGEFSDEDELAFRMPSNSFPRRATPSGYNFSNFYQNSQQPSTSTANSFGMHRNRFLANGDARDTSKDDDVQFVSLTRKPASLQKPRTVPPSLIPISTAFQSSMANGHFASDVTASRPITTQPVRGRRSILDFSRKNRAFNESTSSKASNSILFRNHNIASTSQYEELLKAATLIPRLSNAALAKQMQNDSKPVATINLCDDTENVPANNHEASPTQRNNSYKERKSEFNFKKPSDYVELSDDDEDQTQFIRSPKFSSTQVIKSSDLDRTALFGEEKLKTTLSQSASVVINLPPVNSLKERYSIRESLKHDHFEKLLSRHTQKQAEKNKTIEEEEKNVSQLEKERIQHERIQQKRIDDQITSALTDKCIIIDEEDEVVDEFPPLNEQQNRLVGFALHGSKHEVIVSKFNMNITRHDLATLDGLNWLNDEVINFYMELIRERSEQNEDLPKVHVMNTFFLGKLLQSGHSGVRRWTRKVDIFAVDIIPIPVHVGGVHWCMSVIHMKNKTIRYYDSMGHPNYVVLEALEKYLQDESLDKKKVPFDTSDWTIECIRDCPQQKNGSDCGVFSCQFAEFLSRDSAISFEQQHMPYFRRKMIYEIASGKLMLGA